MEASFAKWFFDLGLRPEPHLPRSIHTVRIWFKGFIPQFLIRGPPFYDCFIGDNRTFSSDRKATGRLNSEVLIENLDTPTPTISQTNYSDLTRQVDCDTEAIIDTATPDTSGTRFYNFRYPGAVVWDWPYPYPPAAHPPEITVGESEPVSLDYVGNPTDPLVLFAPYADIWAHIQLDLKSGLLRIAGEVDDWPAFEGYITMNETYGPFNLFTFDGEDWVPSIIGGANRPINSTISLGTLPEGEQ